MPMMTTAAAAMSGVLLPLPDSVFGESYELNGAGERDVVEAATGVAAAKAACASGAGCSVACVGTRAGVASFAGAAAAAAPCPTDTGLVEGTDGALGDLLVGSLS